MIKFIKVKNAWGASAGQDIVINVDKIVYIRDISDLYSETAPSANSKIYVSYSDVIYAKETVKELTDMIKEKEND